MPRKSINLTWNANYHIREVDNPSELVVLLHGWQQDGRYILGELQSCFSKDAVILAPDAPYPVPFVKNGQLKLGYAWYFFDPRHMVYVIDNSFGLEYLEKLITELGFGDLPKRLVGYSQGGYITPFLGDRLENVIQSLTVNSRYRSEVLKKELAFPVDAINGAGDTIVDVDRAQRCHAAMLEHGNTGDMVLVEGSQHKVDNGLRKAVTEIVAKRS